MENPRHIWMIWGWNHLLKWMITGGGTILETTSICMCIWWLVIFEVSFLPVPNLMKRQIELNLVQSDRIEPCPASHSSIPIHPPSGNRHQWHQWQRSLAGAISSAWNATRAKGHHQGEKSPEWNAQGGCSQNSLGWSVWSQLSWWNLMNMMTNFWRMRQSLKNSNIPGDQVQQASACPSGCAQDREDPCAGEEDQQPSNLPLRVDFPARNH